MDLFGYINSIPNSVLRQGDAVTNDWVQRNPRRLNTDNGLFGSPQPSEADPLGCIIAVGSILVGIAVPAARLLELKKYIKALGGIYEAAKYLIVVGDPGPRAQAIAIALGSLIAELTGIRDMRKCFD